MVALMDPDDAPPEPAPGLTEQDVGFIGSSLDRIREGGPTRIIEEQETAVEQGEAPDASDTPYMRQLKEMNGPAYRHALRWRAKLLAMMQLAPNLVAASKLARVHRDTVYEHRHNDPAFNAAIIEAEELGAAMVFVRAHARATEGDIEPILHQGVVVHHKRKYDTQLQLAMLRAHYPDKFATQSNVKVSAKLTVAAAAPNEMHEIVQTLSPLMAARHLASLTGQRPPELPNHEGGFIRLEDAKQAKATEVQP